jgi:hypothetical protein
MVSPQGKVRSGWRFVAMAYPSPIATARHHPD